MRKDEEAGVAHPVGVATHDVFDGDEAGVDPVYQAKARVLNDAFQEIGMGRYQVRALSVDRIRKAERGRIVVPLHRRRLWLVLVSVTLVI